MSGLYRLARPLLFSLDAERSHELTMRLLAAAPRLATAPFAVADDDPWDCLGLRFPNRVGLAAGLDKNGVAIEAVGRLGFGFIELGTVTPRAQPGNARPRLFRLPQQRALINRMGFNNDGVDALVQRVQLARETGRYRGIIGINIGKNADTPIDRALDDYRIGLQKVYHRADYVTVNISSPNTRNLRQLQEQARLQSLIGGLEETRRRLADASGRRVPLLLKIAPDMEIPALGQLAETARSGGIDGLIATNTTLARPGVERHPLAQQSGGLSGAPLRDLAEAVLRALRAAAGPSYPLIGVGGILSAGDAAKRIAAGADLIQIYSGLVYRGPALVSECVGAVAATRPLR